MKILITGNRGYVGSHLQPMLESQGHTVEGFDLLSNLYPPGTCPIMLPEFIKELTYECDVIIHLGAQSDSQYTHPDIFRWNYEFTRDLVSGLHYNQRFIYFSSCMAINPTTHYGWSKRCAEDIIRAYRSKNIIFRPFNIYGGNEPENRHSIPQQLVDGDLEYVFSDITRDYIHVDDVCKKVLGAVKGWAVGTFEIGTGVGVKPTELADIVGLNGAIITESDKVLKSPVQKELVANPDFMWNGGHDSLVDVKEWCRVRFRSYCTE